jgi:fatty-acyl-CoA synthase
VAPALPAGSFDALLRAQAAQRPHALALRWRDPASPHTNSPNGPWTQLTYADLAQRAHAIAAQLAPHLQRGDRVAWLGLNHPAQLALLFALARLGAVLVPLNHRLSPAEWCGVLQDCTPSLLVHDDTLAAAAHDLAQQLAQPLALWPVQALHTGGETCTAPAPDAPLSGTSAPDAPKPEPLSPDAHSTPANANTNTNTTLDTPLLLVYTSGTTGQPKGAVHTQGNLLANMAIAAQVQGMTAADTVLTVLPLFHVGGLGIQTLPALSVGAQVVLFSRFDAAATLACLHHERPTLTLQVPATLQALTSHPQWADTDIASLRAVWAGSSLLPPEPLRAFMARGVPVCNVYGSTETGPFSIALPPTHARSHLGSCGWPAPGVEVALRDAQGQPVPPGAVGELWVRAPNVVRHYWPDRPALDDAGYFHTGDLAQQAADGSHTVVGRAKDMVISGGENIYPAEIENLLAQHPRVAECAVLGQPDTRWGETVVAVVVLHPDTPPSADWAQPLQQFLDGRLARYKWPRRWLRVDALPKTALGKVQKAALQRQLGTGA